MKSHIAVLLLIASISFKPLFAQETTSDPKTKLEAFDATTGVVVVIGFSSIGTVNGLYNTSAEVDVREMLNAQSGSKQYGLMIEVTGSRDSKARAFVDYDEIESLILGIDYILKIDKAITSLDSFQADYRTNGDLKLSTFNSGGRILFSVEAGRIGAQSSFMTLENAATLRNIFAQAKSKIDEIRN